MAVETRQLIHEITLANFLWGPVLPHILIRQGQLAIFVGSTPGLLPLPKRPEIAAMLPSKRTSRRSLHRAPRRHGRDAVARSAPHPTQFLRRKHRGMNAGPLSRCCTLSGGAIAAGCDCRGYTVTGTRTDNSEHKIILSRLRRGRFSP
jgi:hypothetical protein